jgi:capsular polysaccharide export protein
MRACSEPAEVTQALPLQHVRLPRPAPANLSILVPELASARPGSPGSATILLEQAALAAPPFGRRTPWTSLQAMTATGRPIWLDTAPTQPPSAAEAARTATLLAAIGRARVGGAFWTAPPDLALTAAKTLACLPTEPGRAAAMIARVCASEAASTVVLLTPAHPGIICQARASGCRVAIAPCDPWPLLDAVETVHVAEPTPLAVLALAAGRQLICADLAPDQSRGGLLHAARYADPFRARQCSPEEVVFILAEWRRLGDVGRGIGSMVQVAWWKRRAVTALLDHGAGPPPAFASPARAVALARRRAGSVLVWPSVMPASLPSLAAAAAVPVWQLEDGFVRSVGLGADSAPPCSLVIDRNGIYFDPVTPSDLEVLLQTAPFPADLLARATTLIDHLVTRQITKYNTGAACRPLDSPPGRRVLLVPGQVSDDRSVLLGGAGISDNLDLLARVRARAPDAFIVYNPHPDVDAGQRAGAIPDAAALRFADTIVRGVALPALLAQADELHTLTSLAGFEALLRQRPVTTYGQPFYAGWGLTTDLAPIPRRTRRLTLQQLVAATLLLYPRYLDPVTELPCPIEILLERLAAPQLWHPGPRIRLRQAYGRAKGRWRGWWHAATASADQPAHHR